MIGGKKRPPAVTGGRGADDRDTESITQTDNVNLTIAQGADTDRRRSDWVVKALQAALVLTYDRGSGVSFAEPAMQQDFRRAIEGYDQFHGSNYAAALPRNPDGVLTLRVQNEFVLEWVKSNFAPTLTIWSFTALRTS